MSNFVLISSQNRLESGASTRCLQLAMNLAGLGHAVTVFMVQNGVFAACGDPIDVDEATRAGVRVLADAFSLRERGIAAQQISRAVQPSSLDFVVDRLAAGDKIVWH
ncbi:MAG: sulfur reduction protein DsrE [Pseudomonadota bacterium]